MIEKYEDVTRKMIIDEMNNKTKVENTTPSPQSNDNERRMPR